ncbi:MAG: hydantoinase/oxoprolinase N-terminal domain-containing protein, partial [Candidatus Jordarchaeaceae archaeon]
MSKSKSGKKFSVKAIALDTGGTMSDTFIIDEKGRFAVGKALTTPQEESVGILNSIADALSYWNT